MKLDALIYVSPLDFLPWLIAVALLFLAAIAAMLYDDSIPVQRRRAQRNRTLGLAQRAARDARFTPGRSTAATATAVIPTFPAFTPEPLEPGPHSPLGGEVEGDPEPEPVDEPVDPLIEEMERQFRSGYTLTDPRFAAILRQAYAQAETGAR